MCSRWLFAAGDNMNSYEPVRLAYRCFEPQTADGCSYPVSGQAPIVFLHGLTSCKETWADIPQVFANKFRRKAYTLDVRNHGDSDWSDCFTTDDLVNDLLFFMDGVHAERAILVGHSMGGTIAIHMALEAPERVEMIVVEEMFVSHPPEILLDVPLQYIRLAPLAVQKIPAGVDGAEASQFIMDYVRSSIPRAIADVHIPSKVDQSTMALRKTPEGRLVLKANMATLEKSLLNVKETLKELQGSFDRPTCFIYGKESPFQITMDAENITKFFPNAVFVGIDHSRHTVHSDNTQDFIDAVVTFLVRNGALKNRL